jgi:hypothetical protein
VQTVGDLYEQHAHIARSGDHHLAKVLCSGLFGGSEADPVELGHSVDEQGDLEAHFTLHVDQTHLGVLHGVVKQRGRHRGLIQAELGADGSHLQRVGDEWITRLAALSRVRHLGHFVGPLDRAGRRLGPASAQLFDEELEARIGGLAAGPYLTEDPLDPARRRRLRRDGAGFGALGKRGHMPLYGPGARNR